MKKTQNTLTSQQARERYSHWLRNRTAADSTLRADGNLPLPTFPEYFYWPEQPEYDGLLPVAHQNQDLIINVPAWPLGAIAPIFEDLLTIEWKYREEADFKTIITLPQPGPNLPTDPDVQVTIPKFFFRDNGVFDMRYRVTGSNGTSDSSLVQSITLDRIAPNYGHEPDQLSFVEPDAEAGDITQAYLDAHGDMLKVSIPDYLQAKEGDTVQVFLEGSDPDPAGIPAYEGDIFIDPREDDIPGNRIRRVPDGPLFIRYRLIDKIGNASPRSSAKVSYLAIKPLPTGPLEAPRIYLAEDNSTLINMADAAMGVNVYIKRYPNWSPVDDIEVSWGGEVRALFSVGQTSADPIEIPIPYAILKAAYGATTLGNKITTVKYSVIRGSNRVDSLETIINVDLSLPGPVNPDEPSPVNPDLPLVTVRGGGGAPEDNKLLASDIGLSAIALVNLYDPVEVGQRMELYWGSLELPVATYDIRAADVPGQSVSFIIPWSDIETEPGSSTLPVYYKIRLISGGGDANTQQSANRLVDVTGALPLSLGNPEFPDQGMTSGSNPLPVLNCRSYISDGSGDYYVRVKIPGNAPLLKGGDTVSVIWQPYSDYTATTPVDSGRLVLPNKVLTNNEAINGYEIQIKPYATHIEVVGNFGAVKVSYTGTPVGGSPIPGEATIYASSTSPAGPCYIITP